MTEDRKRILDAKIEEALYVAKEVAGRLPHFAGTDPGTLSAAIIEAIARGDAAAVLAESTSDAIRFEQEPLQ